jgi:4-hydroxybenzoate polyprenyltransferase
LSGYAILLSFVGMGMAIAYPFLKRVTHLPQLGLGFAFSWGLPMAFAAELNTIPPSAWILYLTAIIWTLVYDTMYAMTDRKDDLKIGLKSTAILFGDKDILILGILQIIFFLGLIFSGYLFHLKPIYYLGIFVAAGLAIYQQILIRNREPGACFKAFLNNHYLGFSIFLGIVLSELS